MSNLAIQVNGLKKKYGPDQLSFTVPRGTISGFLGPNGSGKTTTLRILMGLAHASDGDASLLDVPVGSTHEIFRKVAFVPEVKELYPMAKAGEMIRLTRQFYPEFDMKLARELAEEWEIPEKKNCMKLSKGMKAKLWLILALCRKPELLVLDEPTDGLDPASIERTLQLLVQHVAEHNATVFFSTHQLPEVEQIADHLVMIKKGQCVINGDIDEVKGSYRHVQLKMVNGNDPLPADFTSWQRDGRLVSGFTDKAQKDIEEELAGFSASVIEARRATLKEIYLNQVAGS